MTTPVYTELDDRKRVSLAKFAPAASYLLTAEAGGRIILEPAVVMTQAEMQILADPQIRAQYEAAIESGQPRHSRPARRP